MTEPLDDEVLQILARIEKLSQRPYNPGVAYRNLEIIHDLVIKLGQHLQDEACSPLQP